MFEKFDTKTTFKFNKNEKILQKIFFLFKQKIKI